MFSHQFLYKYLFSPVRATWATHLIAIGNVSFECCPAITAQHLYR
jgi:hypothetical protein